MSKKKNNIDRNRERGKERKKERIHDCANECQKDDAEACPQSVEAPRCKKYGGAPDVLII
jgi:hypothetical protein